MCRCTWAIEKLFNYSTLGQLYFHSPNVIESSELCIQNERVNQLQWESWYKNQIFHILLLFFFIDSFSYECNASIKMKSIFTTYNKDQTYVINVIYLKCTRKIVITIEFNRKMNILVQIDERTNERTASRTYYYYIIMRFFIYRINSLVIQTHWALILMN